MPDYTAKLKQYLESELEDQGIAHEVNPTNNGWHIYLIKDKARIPLLTLDRDYPENTAVPIYEQVKDWFDSKTGNLPQMLQKAVQELNRQLKTRKTQSDSD